MKFCLFLFLGVFYMLVCFGQDTVNHKNWLTSLVLERYKTLKPDENIRVGPYKAYFRRKTLIADGRYDRGIKVGVWNFYNEQGKLNQRFDFDKTEYIYEAALDSNTDIQFSFDAEIKPGDRVTRPLKIGGMYYGLIPYINIFHLPFKVDEYSIDNFHAVIELLISPHGRLADYKVRVQSATYRYDQTFNFDVNLFGEEDKQFSPATVNRQPVLVRVFIRCAINADGSLDFFNSNSWLIINGAWMKRIMDQQPAARAPQEP